MPTQQWRSSRHDRSWDGICLTRGAIITPEPFIDLKSIVTALKGSRKQLVSWQQDRQGAGGQAHNA